VIIKIKIYSDFALTGWMNYFALVIKVTTGWQRPKPCKWGCRTAGWRNKG